MRRLPDRSAWSRKLIGASAGLLVALAAPADVRVTADTGIAAGRDLQIGGEVVFGVSAVEVQALLEERSAFLAAHAQALERLGENLELGECTVVEMLRRIASEDPEHGVATGAERLAALTARYRTVAAAADALDDRDPDAAGLKRAVLGANRVGDVERAEAMLVAVGRGIAAGRDVEIRGDVVFGIPRATFQGLLDALASEDSAQAGRLQALSVDLQVNRCATASFLRILGEREVPVEQLHARLREIAERHLGLVGQLRALTTQDPEIEALRKAAADQLDAGALDAADRLLREAQQTMQRKAAQASPLMADYARVEADLGRLELLRLRYEAAAEAFRRAAQRAAVAGDPLSEMGYRELAAGAYQDAGMYRKAEGEFLDVLQWREDHPEQTTLQQSATTLNNLGTLHYAQSDYDSAALRFDEALQILLSDRASSIAPKPRAMLQSISLNGLADTALAVNDFQRAEDYYRRALAQLESAYGSEGTELVAVLTNWARLETVEGHFAGAEELYRRAVGINRARRAPGDPESAVTMNNLAVLYYLLRRYDEAEGLWKQAFDVYRSALGEDHVITLGVLQNLAKIHRRNDRLDEAERLYQHALAVWQRNAKRRRVDKDHLVMASLYDGIGDLYVSQGRLSEAEERYLQGLDIVRSRLGRDHSMIGDFRNDLAVVYEREGRLEDAEAAYLEARDIFRRTLGEAHPNFGTVTGNLARIEDRLGRTEQAEKLYLEAIGVAANLGDDIKVAARSRRLAKLYQRQGRLDEARERLQIAQTAYDRRLGPDHRDTQAVSRELAQLPQVPVR